MDGAGAAVTFRTRTPRSTPASSLANDLKIPLTCSKKKREKKKKRRGGRSLGSQDGQFKKSCGPCVCVRVGEVTEMYGHILKIHFCISDNICLQQHKGDFIRLRQSPVVKG